MFSGRGVIQDTTYLMNHITGLPSSVCVVDCAINGFIGDQISLLKAMLWAFKTG